MQRALGVPGFPRPQPATALENRKRWQVWKAAGVNPTHGEEPMGKRGEVIARNSSQQPRKE
jgi:hypothetical protein